MAKIKKLKNGKYRVQIYDENGIRKRPTFDRKPEAEAFIMKIEAPKTEKRMLRKKVRKSRTVLTKALLDFEATKNDLRAKSKTKYAFVIDQFKSFCEGENITYLDEFTPEHGNLLYNELKKERLDTRSGKEKVLKPKAKTVNFFLQTVKAFFKDEIIKGHLDKSPVDHIKNLKADEKRPDFYTQEEINKFFKQEMPDYLRNSFLGFLHTGMRFEELANLTWNDVDLSKKLLHVRPKGTFKTKTFNSQRSIPMNKTLQELLKVLCTKKQSDYVFCSSEGSKLRERRLLDQCKKIAKAAGITSRVYIHKFRHTFASHLVQKGVRIEVIQKLLGHASIQDTMIYAHLKPEQLHSEVSVLDDLVK